MKNLRAHVMHVNHADLEKADDKPSLRRVCPVCNIGLLVMRRDPVTYVLSEHDNCLLCGQPVVYDDIAQVRAADWVKTEADAS